MKHSILLCSAVFGLALSGVALADDMGGMKMDNMGGMSSQPAKTSTANGVGVVKAVDAAKGTVTLAHQPIKELSWPAMTMTFHVEQPSLIKGLKQGDRVRFSFDQPPTGPTLRRISKEAGQ